MIYKDEVKREILRKFQEKVKKGVRPDFVIPEIYDEIEGTGEDKDNLIDDCIKYIEIDNLFENDIRYSAIELAERYIEENKDRDINLVDEKLVTFYIDMEEYDLALELVNKLLKKEPDNKWNISKKIKILTCQGKVDRALGYINHEAKPYIKDDPVIFDMQYRLLKRQKPNDIEQRIELIKNKLPLLNTKLSEERQRRFLINLENYYNDMRTCVIDLLNKKDNPKANLELITFLLEEIEQCKEMIKAKRKEISEQKEGKTEEKTTKEEDSKILKQINDMLFKDKNNPEIKQMISKISNEKIRFLLSIQLEHATGKQTSVELAKKVLCAQESRKDDEQMQVFTGLLLNFLSSKNAKEYYHYKWSKLQQDCIRIITEDKKEKIEKQK